MERVTLKMYVASAVAVVGLSALACGGPTTTTASGTAKGYPEKKEPEQCMEPGTRPLFRSAAATEAFSEACPETCNVYLRLDCLRWAMALPTTMKPLDESQDFNEYSGHVESMIATIVRGYERIWSNAISDNQDWQAKVGLAVMLVNEEFASDLATAREALKSKISSESEMASLQKDYLVALYDAIDMATNPTGSLMSYREQVTGAFDKMKEAKTRMELVTPAPSSQGMDAAEVPPPEAD